MMRPCLLPLVALSLVSGACGAPAQAAPAEHRGLWLGTATYDTPEKAEAAVARAAAAHLNALYPLVWYNGGQAWFRSGISPLAEGVDPQYDPLGYLLRAAHARGLEVHAWFVNGSYGWAYPGVVFTKHPDWALQPARPTRPAWYDLGKPEVRQFQTEVMVDCLRRYDIDGLHFDYIRYDNQDYCYCSHCQQEFSKRTGLPPLTAAGTRFPAVLSTSGNPLGEPTTAQVLAVFDDGVPAVTLNKLGSGEAALLNWQCLRPASPAADDTIRRLLQRFGVTEANLYQLRSSQTAAKYRPEAQTDALEALKQLGFKAKVIGETQVGSVAAGGTIVLVGQYYLGPETAAWLRGFVAAGGHALFLDGPVFAIREPALQEVLGLQGTSKYFSGLRVISPAAGQDFLTPGPAVDVEQEKTRHDKWVQYRKWTVTELVRAVREQARQAKPQARLSAAVFYNRQAADAVCQDWYAWLKDGLIDLALPMAYLMENEKLQAALEEYQAADPQMARIVPGLSVYMKDGGQTASRPPELVLSQVELCRRYGAHGNLFFSIANLSDEQVSALAAGPYSDPAPVYWP